MKKKIRYNFVLTQIEGKMGVIIIVGDIGFGGTNRLGVFHAIRKIQMAYFAIDGPTINEW